MRLGLRALVLVVCTAAWACSSDSIPNPTPAQALAIAGQYRLFAVDAVQIPVDIGRASTTPSGGYCDLVMDSGSLSVTDRGGNSGDFTLTSSVHYVCYSAVKGEPGVAGGSIQIAKQGSVDVVKDQIAITQPSGGDLMITSVTIGGQGGLHVGATFAFSSGVSHELTFVR